MSFKLLLPSRVDRGYPETLAGGLYCKATCGPSSGRSPDCTSQTIAAELVPCFGLAGVCYRCGLHSVCYRLFTLGEVCLADQFYSRNKCQARPILQWSEQLCRHCKICQPVPACILTCIYENASVSCTFASVQDYA